jgi:hypothetical protein
MRCQRQRTSESLLHPQYITNSGAAQDDLTEDVEQSHWNWKAGAAHLFLSMRALKLKETAHLRNTLSAERCAALPSQVT